jgi:hypothetical protein
MADIATTIDTHLTAYCEPDPAKRTELLRSVWTSAGELVDPPMAAASVEEIAGLVDTVLTHYPDHRFQRTTAVDEHHGFARYGWALVSAEGTTAVAGTDFAQLDADGRLVRVIGFFGEPEAA